MNSGAPQTFSKPPVEKPPPLVEYLLIDPQGFYPGTIGVPESEAPKIEVKDGNIHIYGRSGIIAVIRSPLSVVTRTAGGVVKLPVRKM